MAKRFDVVAVGTLNADLIIVGDAPRNMKALTKWADLSTVELTAAGSVGYCAVDMARLGLKVSLLSSVAGDAFGGWLLERFKSEGIDTDAVKIEKGHESGIGIYMLLFGDRKRPLTARMATHPPWPVNLSKAAEDRLKNARHLHCGGYLHYETMWGAPTEKLFKNAKSLGLSSSLDTQFPIGKIEGKWIECFGGLLEYVDTLFVDENEALNITGEKRVEKAIKSLLGEGPKLVVVKMGSKGAMLATKDELVCQKPHNIKDIQDPIGAGDAFDAGVIRCLLDGMSLKDTARFAAVTAALTLRGIGGTQSAPSTKEVLKILKS